MHRSTLLLVLSGALTLGSTGLVVTAQGADQADTQTSSASQSQDENAQPKYTYDDDYSNQNSIYANEGANDDEYGYYDSVYDYDTDDDAWFDTDVYDTSYYVSEAEAEDEGLFDYEAAGPEWAEDDYGYYDSDYVWTTDDSWFSDWYGESDTWFDVF